MHTPEGSNTLAQKVEQAIQQQNLPRPLAAVLMLFAGQGARAGYLAAIDQGLISMANFLATVILARSASPTELGVYGVGFTTLRLVRSCQEGITIQPLNIHGAALDSEAFKAYATSTSLIQLGMAVLSSAGVAVVGWVLTRLGNDVAGPTLFSLWSGFLWWQLQEYLRRMLYTRGQVLGAMLNTAVANLIRLGIMLWWASQGKLNGANSLHAIALGSLGALIPGLWQTRDYWSRRFSGLVKTWQRNWGFGRWMLGGMIANWAAIEFYPVLTAGMISFAAAGAYRALQNLVAPIYLLLRATDTFLTPRAAKAFVERGKPALARQVHLAYWVLGIPILGLLTLAVLFPKPLLHLLYGETYLEFSPGVVIMALFYGFMYAYWPLQTALKATRTSQPIFIANLLAIIAMFSVGIWMIYRWGVYGTMGGQALNALIVLVVLGVAWKAVKRSA